MDKLEEQLRWPMIVFAVGVFAIVAAIVSLQIELASIDEMLGQILQFIATGEAG